ncbi:MAG: conjugal transfer protein TraG N-terminal domain-containing protein [Burkholderiales bacterium]|nr:conjugal transfer protein TraG N-terminal domain-containing protein [Burkholderiales bacterium]
MHTVYAYWNADQIASVLNAVAMIMGGGDYLTLMKALAVAGLLIAVTMGVVALRGETVWANLLMVAVFYGCVFVPKTTVVVHDVRTNTDYPVANVPLGLALFASETSHIGKWMTESFETAFTPVDEERFSKTGMAFGSRLIEELQQVRADLPSLEGEMAMFVRKCVNPEFIGNAKVLDDLVKSTDLWGFIGTTNGPANSFSLNPARSTFVNNAAMPCPDAYAALTVLLDGQTNNQIGVLGARVNPGNSMAATVILSQIPAVEATLLNVSRSAQDAVRQSIVSNLLRDCRAQPLSMQSGCVQSSAAVAMAEESAKVSYAAMAKVAAATLPKLRNAIELITIGVFPVVFLLIVIAGAKAGMVLKSYVAAMFWVQLWAPLYAIINAMAVKSDKADLLGIVHLAGGTTLANMTRLGNEALSNQSIAGLLTISVPVIALALIKGGEVAMSGVVSSIMGPAQGAAQKAGDSIGQGNITGGTVSWGIVNTSGVNTGNWGSGNSTFGNISANKQNTTPERSGADHSITSNADGKVWQNSKGDVTGAQVWGFNAGGPSVGASTSRLASSIDSSATGVSAIGTTGVSKTTTDTTSSTWSTSNGTRFDVGTYSGSYIGGSQVIGSNWGTDSKMETGRTSQGQATTYRTQTEQAQLGINFGGSAGVGGGGSQGGGSQVAGGQSGGRPSFNFGAKLGVDGTQSLQNSYTGMTLDSARNSLNSSAGTSISQSGETGSRSGSEKKNAASTSTDLTNATGRQNANQTGKSAAVVTNNTAGTTNSAGDSNAITGTTNTAEPVLRELGAFTGNSAQEKLASTQKAMAKARDPVQAIPAVQRAAEGLSASPTGEAVLSAGGVQPPQSQGAVKAGGDKAFNDFSKDGPKNPSASPAPSRSPGGATPPTAGPFAPAGGSPGSPVDLSRDAAGVYGGYAGQATGTYNSQKAETENQAGATFAGVGAFRNRSPDALTAARNELFGGLTFNSASGYASILQDKAANDPALRSELSAVAKNGGQMTENQQKYFELKLRK